MMKKNVLDIFGHTGNCVKLYKKTHTASVRDGHFFLNRVINVWNSLPDTVVSSATFTGFKLKLKFFSYWIDVLTVSRLCNLGASVRAGLLPWCPDQHIFHRTVFSYILLVVFHLSSVLFILLLFVLSNIFDLI